MGFEDNTMLFGFDPTPRIVAIELGDTGTVKVYRREEDGDLVRHRAISSLRLVRLRCDRSRDRSREARGRSEVWLAGERQQLEGTDRAAQWLEECGPQLLRAERSGAALSHSHRSDLVQRAAFRPTQTAPTRSDRVLGRRRSRGSRGRDHIASIALSDNSGWEELIIIDPAEAEESERAAIKRLTSIIKERDPDVIEGHDLFRFDLPYLVARARKAKMKLDWGRSGGFLRSRPSRLQIAEKTIDYPKFASMAGISSTLFCSRNSTTSGCAACPGFERLDVAQHFGFCDSAEISSLTGKELQRAYLEDNELFRKRALCAVRETRAVADLLSPSYFIQAQIFPYNYQDVIVRGNATRINALFLREYYRQRHSIPEMPMARGFEGGYTDDLLHRRGAQRLALRHRLALSVGHAAVRLLSGDRSAADLPQPLTDLRTFRLEAKASMRAATDARSSNISTRCRTPSKS